MRVFLCIFVILAAIATSAATLVQVVSHENPLFHTEGGAARLTVGRDGLVYVYHGGNPSGYVLRLGRDGGGKTGGILMYCVGALAANADGILVSADAHFTHSMNLLDRGFAKFAAYSDIASGDAYGWDAPRWVEAGASGDFYGLDQYHNRLLRVSTTGKLLATYPIKAEGGKMPSPAEFRVCEQGKTIYYLANQTIYCAGQDGVTRWSVPAPVGGNQWDGFHGGYDVTENGTLYFMDQAAQKIERVGPDGKALPALPLIRGGDGPLAYPVTDLRIFGGEAILKRRHPSELFQVYDLATGALKAAPQIDFEKLTVTCPEVWTAGTPAPFTIDFTVGARPVTPHWRVWVCPVGTLQYRELMVQDGQLQVPPDLAGLYQLKVSPETRAQQGGTASEYLVHDVVDIRPMGQFGAAVVSTAGNRTAFRAGESIDFTIAFRGAPPPGAGQVTVNVLDAHSKPALHAPLELAGKAEAHFTLADALAPGTYACTVAAPFFTCVPQYFTIGWGTASPFKLVQYGDYNATYPNGDYWNSPDTAAAAVAFDARLGINLKVDRLGLQRGAVAWDNNASAAIDTLAKRVDADPLATPSAKLRQPAPFLQAMARYSATGIDQMAILMSNDAGLPIGTGFDGRTKEQFTADITAMTNALKPFPAFRGWSWASNWWVGKSGADATANPTEKQAYLDAVKAMKETGAWSPVLDMVSYNWLNFAPQAESFFRDVLHPLAPGAVTATAAPYRHVFAYPPITFSNVDEVDLHIQWEQMAVPYFAPHDVDFYKRPGKPAWAHPEVWNDGGTGEQILPTLFSMVMRGADGVGFSGAVYPWGAQPEDSRQSYNGLASIFRAGNGLLAAYGPWLTTLKAHDRVAIVADSRMFRLDEWTNVWGTHFARVKEAYATCLHAHRPASIVFVEDMKPDTLLAYRAVLLVDQRVELEPELLTALAKTKAGGTAIFADDTCRPELVKDYTSLHVAFNHFEKDPGPAGDDDAYWRFPAYCKANLPALTKALAGVAPTADTANDEVFVSERVSGDGRFLFVLNNTTPQLDPGKLWRATLCVTARTPVIAPLHLDPAKAVYDCFALKAVTPQHGAVDADLRNLPLRVYALLPATIDAVVLKAPKTVALGEPFLWAVTVVDDKGKPINAGIPVRVRALLPDGTVLQEQSAAADKNGARGTFMLPINATGVTLEAQELCGGKVATLPIAVAAKSVASTGVTGKATRLADAAELRFGPHLKDIAVSADGTTALCNAMNWDENLYGIDTATGALRWGRKVGDYFAFAPQALPDGYAVQGFDFNTAEGYHLYLLDKDGTPQRRFALYGLSRRLPQRFIAGMFNDRMNQFTTNGTWMASAGDLGVAAWTRDGKALLQRDDWPTNRNVARSHTTDIWGSARLSTPVVAALDADTLLVADGMTLTAYNPAGTKKWQRTLASSGEVVKILTGKGGLSVLQTTTEGGRIVALLDDKPLAEIPTVCDDVALSPDGARVAVIQGNLVKLYSLTAGLQWVFPADDHARNPRFADDGRLAVTTDIGTVYVLDANGTPLLERDLGALAVPAWLADGDLLLATWMGRVTRLDGTYKERWNTVLRPAAPNMNVWSGPTLPGMAPTTRVAGWGNADAVPAPLAPNALAKAPVTISFLSGGRAVELQNKPETLFDGKPDAPAQPWLPWGAISWLGEGSAFNCLQLDFATKRVRATGITFVEDPQHPESWLRDAYLETYDAAKDTWLFVQPLLSDDATHTHTFKTPVESTRFRIVLPPGVVGNLRLGELVLHGDVL